MEHLIYGLVTFFIIYFLYLSFLVNRRDKVIKIYKSTEATILKNKFKVNVEKISAKRLANIIGLTNSFIIALTMEVILIFSKNFLLQMILGFIVLIVLILISYPLIALLLRKKYE